MIGLKVVCIGGQELDYRLKVGGCYTIIDDTVIDVYKSYYVVLSEKGERVGWVPNHHFKTISERTKTNTIRIR